MIDLKIFSKLPWIDKTSNDQIIWSKYKLELDYNNRLNYCSIYCMKSSKDIGIEFYGNYECLNEHWQKYSDNSNVDYSDFECVKNKIDEFLLWMSRIVAFL